MRVAVIGASGFVGSRLVKSLLDHGHEVLALTRRPADYRGPGVARFADLDDPPSLRSALQGADAAYYLAHALNQDGFAEYEAAHARAFVEASDEADLAQIVFLGGLGRTDEPLSPHLASRRDVESILAFAHAPLTIVRAGIIMGEGSAGWEILRQSLQALPVVVADRRARTRHQPIAADDAIGYLVDVLGRVDCHGEVLEIGGADVLSYKQMIKGLARLSGRIRPVVYVPWAPTPLTALGVAFITDIGDRTALNLLKSIGHETVVTTDTAAKLVPRTVMGYDESVRRALIEAGETRSLISTWGGLLMSLAPSIKRPAAI